MYKLFRPFGLISADTHPRTVAAFGGSEQPYVTVGAHPAKERTVGVAACGGFRLLGRSLKYPDLIHLTSFGSLAHTS